MAIYYAARAGISGIKVNEFQERLSASGVSIKGTYAQDVFVKKYRFDVDFVG